MPAQKTKTTTTEEKKGEAAAAAAANRCELDGVDGDGDGEPGLGWLGGGEEEKDGEWMDGAARTRAEDGLLARSLARSLLMNETLKAARRPRFHVVILRFIIHLSLSLSPSLFLPPHIPSFLLSFFAGSWAGSEGKERPEVLEVTN